MASQEQQQQQHHNILVTAVSRVRVSVRVLQIKYLKVENGQFILLYPTNQKSRQVALIFSYLVYIFL